MRPASPLASRCRSGSLSINGGATQGTIQAVINVTYTYALRCREHHDKNNPLFTTLLLLGWSMNALVSFCPAKRPPPLGRRFPSAAGQANVYVNLTPAVNVGQKPR